MKTDLCAFCERVRIEYRWSTTGNGGIFETQTGHRHYPRCAEWRKATGEPNTSNGCDCEQCMLIRAEVRS